MRGMTARRRRLVAAVIACAACAPVARAGAVGPPLPSAVSGRAGAVVPGGTERLVARPDGADTVVAATRRDSGQVLRWRRLAGRWSVPPVTLDDQTTGLAADGGTWVLVRPTREFPAASTRLAVLDARALRVRREITLAGFFTVDAIAPDGGRVFLIQYAGGDPLDYRVRALDTRTGRLVRRAVVDPRAPGEQMGGLPMTRATSRDGRWVYTLYGGGDETFIHALDTVGATAACIDLAMLPPGGDLARVDLGVSADGRRVTVRDRGTLVATVNTRTFAVRAAASSAVRSGPAALAPDRAGAAAGAGGGFPLAVLLVGAAALGAAAVAVAVRRRGRPAARRGGSLAG